MSYDTPVTAGIIVKLEPHFIVAAPKLGSQISAVYPICTAVTEYIQFLNAILFARQCKVFHVNEITFRDLKQSPIIEL